MATANYNKADMETVISNSATILTNITTTADSIDGIVGSVDRRVYDYFEFFKELHDKSSYLRYEETNANNFGNWMTDTYNAFLSVKSQTEGSAGKGPTDLPIVEAGQEFPTINVDPTTIDPYKITSTAWDNLSTEDKKAIEAKLKELGFTDEEIQAIKDGNSSVNKTVLDKLDSALQKLNNDGSDVRQVILEKYGFDVFNEDGTVNKDKLALALLIDGKDPNDDYDLVNLLKTKYGIDLFPDTTTNPATGPSVTPVTPPTDPSPNTGDGEDKNENPTTVHTGVGFGGDDLLSTEDVDLSDIDAMLNGDDSSLLDGLGNLTGSLINGNNGLDIGFNNGKGGSAAGAAVAGVAGLGAAATAAALLAKKRKGSALLDDEEDDDDDDDFDDDLDDDDFSIDEEDILGDSEEITDDINSSKKKKKDWLYGLGIGLAGAGLAAGLLAKDDDEDEDDE